MSYDAASPCFSMNPSPITSNSHHVESVLPNVQTLHHVERPPCLQASFSACAASKSSLDMAPTSHTLPMLVKTSARLRMTMMFSSAIPCFGDRRSFGSNLNSERNPKCKLRFHQPSRSEHDLGRKLHLF